MKYIHLEKSIGQLSRPGVRKKTKRKRPLASYKFHLFLRDPMLFMMCTLSTFVNFLVKLTSDCNLYKMLMTHVVNACFNKIKKEMTVLLMYKQLFIAGCGKSSSDSIFFNIIDLLFKFIFSEQVIWYYFKQYMLHFR